jgi:hypothetical protein
MLGTLYNPYSQYQVPQFGNNTLLPAKIDHKYASTKGNPLNALNYSLQYPPATCLPNTMTKSGESKNITPTHLPANLVNVKFPQRSTSSHAIIEQDRVGVQLGEPDIYLDNPNNDWTYGIQYYTPYTGQNLKTLITPVIYPQAYRDTVWAQNTVNFDQINTRNIEDITEVSMDYSCKGCDIASASLGAPVLYESRNPNAPLPVSAFIGERPNIGYYTAREIGNNSRNWPQPVNPIVELQRRKMGLPGVPIMPDYDDKLLKQLRHGFTYS